MERTLQLPAVAVRAAGVLQPHVSSSHNDAARVRPIWCLFFAFLWIAGSGRSMSRQWSRWWWSDTPVGVSEISRWLSAAKPPEQTPRYSDTDRGRRTYPRAPLCDP